jgi:cytochrome c oxidase subunit II
MFAQHIIWFPSQASTSASSVDQLLYMLTTICGIVGLGVAAVLIYFAVRYRRRRDTPTPAEMRGNTPLELTWTITPMLIFIVFFVLGAIVYFDAYRPPDDATEIYVVGKQWMWKVQHPEGQREINELHVPVGQSFKLMLTSEDVIHSFFVPAFRVHMDVLPGRYSSVWFQASQPGQYHLFCSQYCGTNHAGMVGTVYVMEPADYERWLHLNAEGSMALEGRKVFLKYRCISCHSADENARAPVLEDLYLRPVHLRDGATVIADDDYIRESIYYPGKRIVLGWEDLMPTYRGQVSPEEINQLIAYLKSLHRGETPNRVEEFAPPVVTPPINTK